jgi:hypothetical protein
VTGWDEIEAAIGGPGADASTYLQAGEAVLENWLEARGATPTRRTREGFRLLALHRQGAYGEPSFNACRETCRELAYHFNLFNSDGPESGSPRRLAMMALLANHLLLFVRGKMEVAGLGEFCCAAKPIRAADDLQNNSEVRD